VLGNLSAITLLIVLKAAINMIVGDTGDPEEECDRVGELIKDNEIDVACVGIGENGHLAFNDPPADFETESPYIVVDLDLNCRKQQMGEGWFATLDDVPKQAISMSISQIMKSKKIVVTVPDERKADAVRMTLKEDISPYYPASILRNHDNCYLYLDKAAASKIKAECL
jgi:glucosamine-6-phosphate deaminase